MEVVALAAGRRTGPSSAGGGEIQAEPGKLQPRPKTRRRAPREGSGSSIRSHTNRFSSYAETGGELPDVFGELSETVAHLVRARRVAFWRSGQQRTSESNRSRTASRPRPRSTACDYRSASTGTASPRERFSRTTSSWSTARSPSWTSSGEQPGWSGSATRLRCHGAPAIAASAPWSRMTRAAGSPTRTPGSCASRPWRQD